MIGDKCVQFYTNDPKVKSKDFVLKGISFVEYNTLCF